MENPPRPHMWLAVRNKVKSQVNGGLNKVGLRFSLSRQSPETDTAGMLSWPPRVRLLLSCYTVIPRMLPLAPKQGRQAGSRIGKELKNGHALDFRDMFCEVLREHLLASHWPEFSYRPPLAAGEFKKGSLYSRWSGISGKRQGFYHCRRRGKSVLS